MFITKGFPGMIAQLCTSHVTAEIKLDCFERIALEAMLPFEKTFRTEDTNSLKMCKDKCLQAGEKCQAISFGVHRRGNGTCQLSTQKYSLTGGRPSGIIYDPDFDLYARKTNCFDLSDNSITMPDVPVRDLGGYSGLPSTPTISVPSRPVESTPILIVNPSPTTSTTLSDTPQPPTSVYGSTQVINLSEGPISTLGPTTTNGDRLYFTQDVYPLYKYPMLYEPNYPAPNEDVYIPGGYASNVPEVADHYRPGYAADDSVRPTPNGPPRPIFGLGYGTGYSYGKPEPYSPPTARPDDYDRNRPDYTARPSSYPSDRPIGPNSRPTRPDFDHTTPSTYYTRPEYGPNRLPAQDQRPPSPAPGSFVDYTNRPDPPQNGYNNAGASARPPPQRDPRPGYNNGQSDSNQYDYVRRNDSAPHSDGSYDDKTISTYFNPEDYLSGNKKRPGSYNDKHQAGYPMDQMKGKVSYFN
ncbi:extensin-like [Teleopsis dalmanni]|uniref:extensin-like n=1 Tax=Teleopsis dalmanni TaxID=139649 RepID=UPI0018CF4E20|nr:extensin-like [Teleopsis dalmanni]